MGCRVGFALTPFISQLNPWCIFSPVDPCNSFLLFTMMITCGISIYRFSVEVREREAECRLGAYKRRGQFRAVLLGIVQAPKYREQGSYADPNFLWNGEPRAVSELLDASEMGRESIAGKLVANSITEAGANRVSACDLHSGLGSPWAISISQWIKYMVSL